MRELKYVNLFQSFETNEAKKLTEEEKEERKKTKEAKEKAKSKKREDMLKKYKSELKEKGYRGFDENLNINEWYGTYSADEDSATIRVEGDGKTADYILQKIEEVINLSQGKFNLYHNDVKIM